MKTKTLPEPVKVETQIAPELPDVIELTFSEVDRATAGRYIDNDNCLICTALKNRGFNADHCDPVQVRVDGTWFDCEPYACHDFLHATGHCGENYSEAVIGKTLILRKSDRD